MVTFSRAGALDPNDQLSAALGAKDDMVDYRGKMIHVAGWAKRFLFDQISAYEESESCFLVGSRLGC